MTERAPERRPSPETLRRIWGYLAKLPKAKSGDRGHAKTFAVARALVHGFALEIDDARPIFVAWNRTLDEPWSDDELEHKLADAASKPHKKPRGYLLTGGLPLGVGPPQATPEASGEPPVYDPDRLAREFLRRHCQTPDGVTLRSHRDGWFRWNGVAYRPLPDAEIEAEVVRFIAAELDRDFAEQHALWKASGYIKDLKPKKATRSRSLDGATLDAIRATVIVPAELEAPIWLDTVGQPYAAAACLPTTVGILRLDHWLNGKVVLETLSPKLFTTHVIPFDPNAGEPVEFLKMLKSQWAQDPDSIQLVREFIGYLLSGRHDFHKFLYIYGPPRSGKGVILRLLGLIFGHLCVELESSAFSKPFGLSNVIGKSVVTMPDVRLRPETEAAELLLKITGGDAVSIDRKYKPHWNGILLVRFVLASNETSLPVDASGAMMTRVLAVRTNESFLGREDRELEGKLAAEVPAIVKWALESYRDLVARGQFVQPESIRSDLTDLEYSISPISEFVDDLCELGPQFESRRDEVYRLWCSWCEACGKKDAGTTGNFVRMLRARYPEVWTDRRRDSYVREKWLVGIAPRGYKI